MEKPNPDNYNSTGFYLDDLEKYNQKNIPKEIIDKIEVAAKECYRTAELRDNKFKLGAILGYQLCHDEVAELKKQNENLLLVAQSALKKSIQSKGLVWDYSDIAIKFKQWIPEKEFENENAAFTFFFEEVYNKP